MKYLMLLSVLLSACSSQPSTCKVTVIGTDQGHNTYERLCK